MGPLRGPLGVAGPGAITALPAPPPLSTALLSSYDFDPSLPSVLAGFGNAAVVYAISDMFKNHATLWDEEKCHFMRVWSLVPPGHCLASNLIGLYCGVDTQRLMGHYCIAFVS